jgi:cytosine/adenosine deaminase-related metal-dependent hydrolase
MYQCKIGKFEKGYSSDFILINYNEITPLNKDNIFGHILFGVFEALKPYAVYIDGNRVVDKHNLIEKDPINIKIVEELWRRL